jgi:hypothetical protein
LLLSSNPIELLRIEPACERRSQHSEKSLQRLLSAPASTSNFRIPLTDERVYTSRPPYEKLKISRFIVEEAVEFWRLPCLLYA